jgi:hypothetical protein
MTGHRRPPRERTVNLALKPIDQSWPDGEIERFLTARAVAIVGSCAQLETTSMTGVVSRVARGRTYAVEEYRVLSDPLIVDDQRGLGHHRRTLLVRAMWAHFAEEIPAENILTAPGVAAGGATVKSNRFGYMAPVAEQTVRSMPTSIQDLARESLKICKDSPSGLWCMSKQKLDVMRQDAISILEARKVSYRLGSAYVEKNIPLELCPNLQILLGMLRNP